MLEQRLTLGTHDCQNYFQIKTNLTSDESDINADTVTPRKH